MTAPISMSQRKGINPATRNQPLTGGAAGTDYSFDASVYNQLLVVADAANTTPVHWRSNASTGGSDPDVFSGASNGHAFVEPGAAMLLTMHETQVLRFKSSANAVIRLMPFAAGDPSR